MDRKKELKEQYKQMKPDMGVYAIFLISATSVLLKQLKI